MATEAPSRPSAPRHARVPASASRRRPPGASDASGASGASGAWLVAGVALLVALTVVLGVARWTGEAPVGSDNDEYRLVARQLVDLDAPVVAGVEATKYPLGYPALLAVIDGVGLPVVGTALALNVALVGAAAGLAALAARHRGAVAMVVAAGVVLLSRPLWAATQSTMPDVALTAVVAAGLALAAAPVRARAGERALAAGLTGVALVAAALKSIGVLVGLAATVALVAGRRARWWLAAAPAAVGIVLAGATALVAARYPEHTTSYARTFWLEDPYDAAGGSASVLEVAGRLVGRADLVAADAARAVWGGLVEGWPAWLLTGALVAAGVAGARRRWFVAAFVVFDLAFLALWPYSSVRFGLPLAPVAALGAGTLASAACDRLRVAAPATAVAGVVVAVLAGIAVPAFDGEADREATLWASLDAARRDAVAWVREHAPGAVLVSPDYRELATVAGAPVHPLSYTSDPEQLLAEARQGTHLVHYRGLYGPRDEVVATLLAAHGEEFSAVYRNDRITVLCRGRACMP